MIAICINFSNLCISMKGLFDLSCQIYMYRTFHIFLKIIYLFLAAVGFSCSGGLSLVAASGAYSLLQCASFPLWWLVEHRLWVHGFQ